MTSIDVIDHLAGIEAGSRLSAIRDGRPQARENAQASYRALFEPADPGPVTARERFALAIFVAGLHDEVSTGAFYRERLVATAPSAAMLAALDAEIAGGRTQGPYGRFPEGPLSVEDQTGPIHRVGPANRDVLGARLSAALDHTHMLVFRPRESDAPALQSLLDGGWSTAEIVTLSQLVAFLTFQIRAVAGLRTLASTMAA